jgi:flagellar hook-associated protein 2
MAGLTSSTGLGSGLDINGLVSQLVAAEKATKQTQITRSQTSTVTTISALASLKGAMSTFNTALTPLKSVEIFASRSATSSDQEYFSASSTPSASPGVYDVQVENLASAHQISSTSFVGGQTTIVGTGTLTIQAGAKSFSISIDDTHNTLAQVRDAINSATDNDDAVTATIIGGRVVFRAGTFEPGFGEGWGAGRFLPARVADVAPRADVPSAVGAASGGARR